MKTSASIVSLLIAFCASLVNAPAFATATQIDDSRTSAAVAPQITPRAQAQPQTDHALNPHALAPNFLVKIAAGNMFTGWRYGRGICLDSPCVHVVTNYHVAGLIAGAKVEGVAIKSSQYATGPEDPDAVPMRVMDGVHLFNPQQDLALLTLAHALPGRFAAAQFADYAVTAGVEVLRYPIMGETYRGKLTHVGPARYLDANQVTHVMQDVLITDFDSPAGVSGGALCDDQGRVIGINSLRNNGAAIPAAVVSSFLRRVNPALWSRLGFHQVELGTEATGSAIPNIRFAGADDGVAAINALVANAIVMNRALSHIVAEIEMRRTGRGVDSHPQRYEMSFYDNGIQFRRIVANGTPQNTTTGAPLPQYGVTASAEWDYLLQGLERASITYLGQTTFEEDAAHAFQFTGMSCPFRERRSAEIWDAHVPCSGEVWTDSSYHPLLIRAALRFEPASVMAQFEVEVRFRVTQLARGYVNYLPARVSVKARYKNSPGVYTATNTVIAYRRFGAETLIRTDITGSGDSLRAAPSGE